MRKILATLLVASTSFGIAAVPSLACGDKLLVLGRRAQRVPRAKHAASVLLYLRPGSALPAAAKEMKLGPTLRQAGHRVDTVDQAGRLHDRLAAGRYDFVVTDLSDAASVMAEAASRPGAPDVVPVLYKADEAGLQDSRQTYTVVIQAGKSLSYLSALDAAMGQREGSRP